MTATGGTREHNSGESAVTEKADADRIPVIIGVGEINDRPGPEDEGLDSLGLMLAALKAAEQDSGVRVLDRIDWLGVVDQISFPDPEIHEHLASRLPHRPGRVIRTPDASGDGPIRLINDAANLIARGEVRIAAAAGGEAMRTAGQRAAALVKAGGTPPPNRLAEAAMAAATPLARRYGLFWPADVYPFYENATRAAWGQSLNDAQRETAEIWAGMSRVAAANPAAWLRKAVSADAVMTVDDDNRMISFPYTKMMVANSAVNQGAAVIVASLATARALGVPEDRIVHIGAGAAAHESDDFLRREGFTRIPSLEATIQAALEFNATRAADIDHVELYSCFPCVPKLARRVIGWPLDKPHSVYGGLTFGGGPIGNCMMHAAAQMTQKLRGTAQKGLIVANGGYATHSHSMVFSGAPLPSGTWPRDHDVNATADRLRGPAPELLDDYAGPGSIETFTIPFNRHGAPAHAVIVARTPDGRGRFLARVPGKDAATLAFLMSADEQPVGSRGEAVAAGDGAAIWKMTA